MPWTAAQPGRGARSCPRSPEDSASCYAGVGMVAAAVAAVAFKTRRRSCGRQHYSAVRRGRTFYTCTTFLCFRSLIKCQRSFMFRMVQYIYKTIILGLRLLSAMVVVPHLINSLK